MNECTIRKWRRWTKSSYASNVFLGLNASPTDVHSLRWFQGFNWEGLRRRKLASPLRREVKHNTHFYTCHIVKYVWEIKEEFFHAYCTFFCSVMSLISQLKGPLDHSHFDMFPPELEEPPDELSGWDKDFWERVISPRILFCKYF